jgi:hypothetical protein
VNGLSEELELRLKKQAEQLTEILNKVSNLEFIIKALIHKEGLILPTGDVECDELDL